MERTTLYLHVRHTVGAVDPRLFGGFLEHMDRSIYDGVYQPNSRHADEDGMRRDVLEALRQLRLPIVRHPGGMGLAASATGAVTARRGGQSAKICAESHDADALVFAKCKHRSVASDDDLSVCGKRTLYDSIVWFVRKYGDRLRRFDDLAKIGEEYSNSGELLAITGKLPGKDR